MELSQLVQVLTAHKKNFILTTLLGLAMGVVIFFLPKKYIVEGSFFVGRQSTDSTRIYYSYDGYYGQQAAIAHAETVTALLESKDLKFEALKKLGLETNTKNLWDLNSYVRVKTLGPSLVGLEVKHRQEDVALNIFNALAQSTMDTQQRLTAQTDTAYDVLPLFQAPNVRKADHILWLDGVVGALLGFTTYLSFAVTKAYFPNLKGKK